jgi:molecular chaperone GrpE
MQTMERNDNDGFTPKPGEPGSEDEFAPGAQGGGDDEHDESAVVTDERIADLERRLAEQHDKYLRLVAEYDNYRKRTGKERAESHSRAQGDLAKQLLDALDDLARFAHIDPQTVEAVTVVQGAEMVEKKLMKALASAGLELIDPVDLTFDPTLHEAVATEPALGPEDDHVVARVYQPGYLFNGQLLRPARVVVKQWNG